MAAMFTSGQSSGVLMTGEELVNREKLGFTRWINMYLKPRQVKVMDLFADLADGNILAHLMEVLSGESVQAYGRMKFPADMRIQQIANLSVVFSFMKAHVKLVSIGPQDILEGDEKRILGLIWTLIEHFAVIMINAHLQTDIRSYVELKETLMLWARHKERGVGPGTVYGLEVRNFTNSLADGRIFLALLNDGNPNECKFSPSSRPDANLSTAFLAAEKVYGLVPMMNPVDPAATLCEQVSIIYMASLYLALPSEFDTFVMRCQIYVKVMTWWRRIRPAVVLRRTLQRARVAVWAQRRFKKWRNDSERVELMEIRADWEAQKSEITLLRSQLDKMKEMYAEVGKKAGALPEVMGKFSELQSYAKSLKLEYERRIAELEDHINKMSISEDVHLTNAEELQRHIVGLQSEVGNLQDSLARSKAEYADVNGKHATLVGAHDTGQTTISRLNSTIDEQASRIADLEQQLRHSAEVGTENARLVAELRVRDGTLAENEEQLEEMEEHVENLSSAMVTSEEQVHSLQEELGEMAAAQKELEEQLAQASADAAEGAAVLTEVRDELTTLQRKYEASQDEVAERQQEVQDMGVSYQRLDSSSEALREELGLVNEEKKALEQTRESLKDAIEDMQISARSGTDTADKALGELGGECERAKARLGQLRASFDGRSVIDDVVCLQHVVKLLASELEAAVGAGREAQSALRDSKTRHATVTQDHDSLHAVHTDLMATREQLLQRNEELEAEAERLRKDFDETEYALAEATSKWMHLEQDRTHMANAARKINRHAISSLKTGQLSGILVSSVNLALDDLAAVKQEAISSGLGLGPMNASVHTPSLGTALERSGFNGRADIMGFLDYPTDQEDKGEVYWSEELIQMLCTEIDGLRRTVRVRESGLKDKEREISGLEAARVEITDMRNETEAARDAFYEHKETWEKSITAELTAQIATLREQVSALEDDSRRAQRAVSELDRSRAESSDAITRLRSGAKDREQQLVDQLESLSGKHTAEVTRLKQELALMEEQVSESAKLMDRHRNTSRDTVGRLEDHEAQVRHKQRHIERVESQVRDLEGKLEESEAMASRARALGREKAELEGMMRTLQADHANLGSHLKVKESDMEGAQDREAEKDSALQTAAAKYMAQQTLLDEVQLRAGELSKHAQVALLKLIVLQAEVKKQEMLLHDPAANSLAARERRGLDVHSTLRGRLDEESEAYRAELESTSDLNPALSELMFAKHLMNKLESQVFALKEEDAMKAADFAAAQNDVTSTRAEMEELLDSHQGVVHKMKTLQDKARTINESLQEKGRALDEATAAVDELEAKLEKRSRALESERKDHATTRLHLDEASASLRASIADGEAEVLDLKEQVQVLNLRSLPAANDNFSATHAEIELLRRKLEEKDRLVKDLQQRQREADSRNRTLLSDMNTAEEKLSEMRGREAELSDKIGYGDLTQLKEQVVLLENEKRMAEQDYEEMAENMGRIEADVRNPRLLSVRRAGQMQHIMYDIEDMESKELDADEMARLRALHEDLFNIFEDTLCYLKGGMIQLTDSEIKKISMTLGKCKDPRQCINIFKEAHLSCKKIVISVSPGNTSVANAHWTIPDMSVLDQVPDNRYMELLKNIRNLLVAHDMMDDQSRSKLSTFVEIMMNLDWLVILGHKAIDVEMARKSKALRRSYGGSGASSVSRESPGGHNDEASEGGSTRSHGSRLSYKAGSLTRGGGARSSGYGGGGGDYGSPEQAPREEAKRGGYGSRR